jgi:ethanolamine utilization microcompartment shell protein EutS
MNTYATTPINNVNSEPQAPDLRSVSPGQPFNSVLAEEQVKLDEKNRFNSALPWSELQGIFSALPLQFDFNFSAAKIESDLTRPRHEMHGLNPEHGEEVNPGNSSGKTGSNDSLTARSGADLSIAMDKNQLIQHLLGENNYTMADLRIPFELYSAHAVKGNATDLKLIVSELVDKIRLIKEGEKATLSIALKPENAGKLLLDISVKNGLISISFMADQETRDWLDANIGALEEALRKANINLGNLDVASGRGNSNKHAAREEDIALPEIFSLKAVNEKTPDINYGILDRFSYRKLFGISDQKILFQA